MLVDLGKSRSEDIAFLEDGGSYFMGSLFKVEVSSAYFFGGQSKSIDEHVDMIFPFN